jgi:Carbohydrate binding module (family 6)
MNRYPNLMKMAPEVMRQSDLIKPVGITMALAFVLSIRASPPADYRGKPFDDAAYRAGQRAEAERPALPFRAFTEGLMVWNGTTSTHGAGWVTGGKPGASVSLEEPDADGKRAIHFRAAVPGYRQVAFVWDWATSQDEGVAFHDTTPINILSAVLNQQAIHQRPHATPHHWNFRREEDVDLSYVKDFADLNHPNNPDPPVNQLYIGGTEDGEWCNYTVEVRSSGTYRIIATYANTTGVKPLQLSVDGKPAAECTCPVTTGSMHTWTRQEIGRITFPEAGVHLLTLHYGRGYNLGSLDFEAVK